MKKKWLFIFVTIFYSLFAEEQIARMHYNGGGDWYNDPTSIPNMLNELYLQTGIEVDLMAILHEISTYYSGGIHGGQVQNTGKPGRKLLCHPEC